MNKPYLVTLTDAERDALHRMTSTGQAAARAIRHAQILLLADDREGATDEEISEVVRVSTRTVERVRQRFVEAGLEAAVRPPKVPRTPREIDGAVEAHLVALTRSGPPEGRSRWTLRLLAQKLVELGPVESISHEGVRTTLKKTNRSRGRSSAGASRRTNRASSSARWRRCWSGTNGLTTPRSR